MEVLLALKGEQTFSKAKAKAKQLNKICVFIPMIDGNNLKV